LLLLKEFDEGAACCYELSSCHDIQLVCGWDVVQQGGYHGMNNGDCADWV
jgi:hypothetical protein